MRYLLVLALIGLLFAQTVFAVKNIPPKEKLQRVVQSYLTQYGEMENITAVVLSLKKADDEPITIYQGYTDKTRRTAVASHNLFQMGSLAKSFIAVTVLKLASDPHFDLNLDDKLTKFFPEYTHWSAISIRQLLNMSSGIPDVFKYRHVLEDWSRRPYQYIAPQHWLVTMHGQSLLFKPGTRFHYSNTNYFILGLLIEKLTGKRLDRVVHEKIFAPHDLRQSYLVMHRLPIYLKQQMVRGYQQETALAPFLPKGTDVTDYSLSYLYAAGDLIASPEDLLRWIDALYYSQKVLTPQEFALLHQLISQKTGKPIVAVTARDPLAFGLGISVHYSPKLHSSIYLYEGITAGYRAVYVYVPAKQLRFVIAVNSSYTGKENHLIALINQVASIIL